MCMAQVTRKWIFRGRLGAPASLPRSFTGHGSSVLDPCSLSLWRYITVVLYFESASHERVGAVATNQKYRHLLPPPASMARQEAMIKETIRAMKLAMKRRPSGSGSGSGSDSDGEIHRATNRGNKLKRGASAVQQDRLDITGGLAYKKRVYHASYARYTISTKPSLLDEDGDVYSPTESDHEAERYGEPAHDDPFAHVQLERLLRPLTTPAELADHPSLSVPYKSKALTQMAEESLQMLRRERASLWKAKRLLQRLRGDADWVDCGTFETEYDRVLLPDSDMASVGGDLSAVPSVVADQAVPELEVPPSQKQRENGTLQVEDILDPAKKDFQAEEAGDTMEGVQAVDMAAEEDWNSSLTSVRRRPDADHAENYAKDQGVLHDATAPAARDHLVGAPESSTQAPNPTVADLAEREGHSDAASLSNGGSTHAMVTRRRARSPAERSDHTPSSSPSDSGSIPAVHPWFVPPPSCLADRDLGLPPGEADETRKLLFSYVQKQEQIVRSLESLHAGLQKADRLRHDIYRSCKAEGHVLPDGKGNMVTEMSDGEDWYDVADWYMQPWEVLEKGKDEVDDVEQEERGRRPGRGRRVNRM